MIKVEFEFERPDDENIHALLAFHEILVADKNGISITGAEMWGFMIDAWNESLKDGLVHFELMERQTAAKHLANTLDRMSKTILGILKQV